MVIAMGESAVGGALALEKWCHLLGLQPLCFSNIFFFFFVGFHKHPAMLKTPLLVADGYSEI